MVLFRSLASCWTVCPALTVQAHELQRERKTPCTWPVGWEMQWPVKAAETPQDLRKAIRPTCPELLLIAPLWCNTQPPALDKLTLQCFGTERNEALVQLSRELFLHFWEFLSLVCFFSPKPMLYFEQEFIQKYLIYFCYMGNQRSCFFGLRSSGEYSCGCLVPCLDVSLKKVC